MNRTPLPVPRLPAGTPPLVVVGQPALARETAKILGVPLIDLDRATNGTGNAWVADEAPVGRLSRAVVTTERPLPPGLVAEDEVMRTEASTQTAAELAERYREAGGDEAGTISIPVSGTPTEIRIADGSVSGVGGWVGDALPGVRRAAVVHDPNAGRVPAAVERSLSEAGVRTVHVALPPGEAAKELVAVTEVWRALRDAGIGRNDVVVSVGGGATLDAAGFAAATFHRGVSLVNVPTTLVAMADASVGGKVAVDLDGAKNQVGAFHHPRLVVIDPLVLQDLPVPEIRSGMAEIVKVGTLASPLALQMLEDGLPAGAPALGWLVEQAVRVKAGYVGADRLDRGVRLSLNLGHTFGHAIEAASGFSIRHGDAVAMGLVAAARLGEGCGVTPRGLAGGLRDLLEGISLPTMIRGDLAPDALLAAMRVDKKGSGGEVRFVLPTGDGAVLVDGVSPQQALRAMGVVVA